MYRLLVVLFYTKLLDNVCSFISFSFSFLIRTSLQTDEAIAFITVFYEMLNQVQHDTEKTKMLSLNCKESIFLIIIILILNQNDLRSSLCSKLLQSRLKIDLLNLHKHTLQR